MLSLQIVRRVLAVDCGLCPDEIERRVRGGWMAIFSNRPGSLVLSSPLQNQCQGRTLGCCATCVAVQLVRDELGVNDWVPPLVELHPFGEQLGA